MEKAQDRLTIEEQMKWWH